MSRAKRRGQENAATWELKLRRALERISRSILGKQNVLGFGVGFRRRDGKELNEIVPVFFVTAKLKNLARKELLPATILVDGKRVPTDVVAIGIPESLLANSGPNNQRLRPLNMGCSIKVCTPLNDYPMRKGALGALVRRGNAYFGLSAAHVLLMPGMDVVQPGNGKNRTLKQRNDNVGATVQISADPTIDAGLAEITSATEQIISDGTPKAPKLPILGMDVMKSGPETGLTFSRVVVTGVVFTYPITSSRIHRRNLFCMEFLTAHSSYSQPEPFALRGDSGSLIVEEKTRAALGLVIQILDSPTPVPGGHTTLVVGQEIVPILKSLTVRLVT